MEQPYIVVIPAQQDQVIQAATMKNFKPTHFDDQVNYSREHPIKEFGGYLLKGIFALLLAYILIGATLEFMIMRMSVERENWLWDKIGLTEKIIEEEQLSEEEEKKALQYVQSIMAKMPDDLMIDGYDYEIFVFDDPEANAFAMPGGKIAVTRGLLDLLDTENALAFVIGHELGHVKNRDHLRGMGFNFASMFISILLMGQDGGVLKASQGLFELGWLSNSRLLEMQADELGLDAVIDIYGHANGADEFFQKLLKYENEGLDQYFPTILSTHPGSDQRIEAIQKKISTENIPNGQTKPIKKFEWPEDDALIDADMIDEIINLPI
ncbi:MAG: M48 family metallopeptidase [Bdellovibrionales bacterium]